MLQKTKEKQVMKEKKKKLRESQIQKLRKFIPRRSARQKNTKGRPSVKIKELYDSNPYLHKK